MSSARTWSRHNPFFFHRRNYDFPQHRAGRPDALQYPQHRAAGGEWISGFPLIFPYAGSGIAIGAN
jgi:hypothetical protein